MRSSARGQPVGIGLLCGDRDDRVRWYYRARGGRRNMACRMKTTSRHIWLVCEENFIATFPCGISATLFLGVVGEDSAPPRLHAIARRACCWPASWAPACSSKVALRGSFCRRWRPRPGAAPAPGAHGVVTMAGPRSRCACINGPPCAGGGRDWADCVGAGAFGGRTAK